MAADRRKQKPRVPTPKRASTQPRAGAASQRRTLLLVLGGVLAAAAALAVALVLVSRGGGDASSGGGTTTPTIRSTRLAGIPQKGITLGDPSAPALTEYADLQCPFCGEFARDVLPSVIRDYVRPGKVKLVFRGLAFIGPESAKALRAVYSAGEQDRAWDVLERLYEAQGAENSGWVTDDLLRRVGESVPGLAVDRWLAQTDSAFVRKELADATAAATRHGVRSTPTFFLGDHPVELTALTPTAFPQAIDPLLAG